jgi:YidC/Oxa1 family membrane protein insertase
MPEETSGGSHSGGPKKEFSTEMRMLLAFILMGAVLFLTPYFYKTASPPPPPQKSPAASPTPAPAPTPAPPAPVPAPAAKAAKAAKASARRAAAPPGPATVQRPETPVVIETGYYRITFTNHGATVTNWLLKNYKGNDGKPLDLVNTAARLERPFSLYFPSSKPTPDLNWTYFAQKADPDGLGVTFTFADGKLSARKTFRFSEKSYLAQVATEVTDSGQPLAHLIAWRGGFGDMAVNGPAGVQRAIHFDAASGKLIENAAGAAKNGPATAQGTFSFAGLTDAYFAAVFLPETPGPLTAVTFSDQAPTTLDKTEQPFPGTAVGGAAVNRFALFVGPKDVDILRQVNPKLEAVVDFGWFALLAKPLFLIVSWFNAHTIHNYGWAIVIVTFIINFILFPLKLSSMKSMKKMQALQPQIKAINDRFKDVSMRDPRKTQQNQEVMELYKKHGVNPMGGCMPMALQIPFFIAFYKVFTVSVEMRGATWLWVTDLSQPEHLPIKILPIAMIASQFVMQKMTPTTGGDPTQQRMMMIMPLVFGFMFYNFPSGLVLYYLTSNLVSMGQQWFFNRTSTAMEAARSVEVKKSKTGRK